MTTKSPIRQTFVLHPFFFVVYSVLGVFANNVVEIPVQWVLRPLLFLLIFIAILYFVFKKMVADSQRAGLITTLVLFWLFFGHIQRFLGEKSGFWNTQWGMFAALLLWSLPLFWLGSRWTWNKINNRKFITLFLNATSIIVVLFPLYVTGRALIETRWWSSVYENRRTSDMLIELKSLPDRPDIYLIILDGYGRYDSLREIYGFDNSEFLENLRNRGFYVADQSSPNYPMTWFSLSSLLNMGYLGDYTSALKNTMSHGPVYDLTQHSDVRWLLQEAGYQFVALPSATFFTQMHDADIYYQMTIGNINEFEGLLLSSTVMNMGMEAWHLDIPVPSYSLHRRYILYSLETLKTIPEIAGPKFVFVHIMAPHPPFVLDETGNPTQPNRPYNMGDTTGFTGTPEEYKAGYLGEVRFLNSQLMDAIDVILETSTTPPVIILQGDHGPGNYINLTEPKNSCFKERYAILNAYYFPDQNYTSLYSSITPVNSFRVIFNQYFETKLELLEDRNYYSTWGDPYEFSDVTDRSQTCEIVPDK
jgi:hypothetical protein